MKQNHSILNILTRLILTLSLIVFSFIKVQAQSPTSGSLKYYIVELTSKSGTPYQLSHPEAFLSARSIARKRKFKIPVDSTDLPVNPAFLQTIKQLDLKIINASRWMNQVLITSSNEAIIEALSELPFVKRCIGFDSNSSVRAKVEGIHAFYQVKEDSSFLPLMDSLDSSSTLPVTEDEEQLINYGNNAAQVLIHQGTYLHNRGYTGSGMLIAVLDAGFKGYKTNPIFDSLNLQQRVVMEWDFVANESSVNEDHIHGMQCLSTLAANRPGIMVGTAPHASYLLFRTENAAHELPYEEHTWLVAAEAADSAGADLISSSLGYVDFDIPEFSHAYSARDGKTTLISRAAQIAVNKGILVVNSAGNSGNEAGDDKYISCPGDVPQVFTVGAVNSGGVAAGFSSIGPAYGGSIKPNAVSVGAAAVMATQSGTTTTGNGTSLAAPNLAGLIACLWEAFPGSSNLEIMEAIQKTSDKYLLPNDKYGFGLPDFKRAAELLQTIETAKNYRHILGKNTIKAYPVPFQDELNLSFQAATDGTINIRLLDVNGKLIDSQNKTVKKQSYYTINFRGLSNLQSGVYYLQTVDGKNNNMLPVMRQ